MQNQLKDSADLLESFKGALGVRSRWRRVKQSRNYRMYENCGHILGYEIDGDEFTLVETVPAGFDQASMEKFINVAGCIIKATTPSMTLEGIEKTITSMYEDILRLTEEPRVVERVYFKWIYRFAFVNGGVRFAARPVEG